VNVARDDARNSGDKIFALIPAAIVAVAHAVAIALVLIESGTILVRWPGDGQGNQFLDSRPAAGITA
jgi:hypothetical protein